MRVGKAFSIAVVLFLFQTLHAPYASGFDSQSVYKDYEKRSRELTRELCSSLWSSAWGDQIWAGVRHNFTAEDFMTLPPELRGLMESDGYEEGLRDCFGDNRTTKDRFTIALLVSSSAARFAGLYGTYRAAGALAGRLAGVAPAWLMTTRWALTNPRIAAAASQTLRGVGRSIPVVSNMLLFTGLGLWAFSATCERNPGCYRWLVRLNTPSEKEVESAARKKDLWLAQLAIQIAMQKLTSERAELAALSEGADSEATRLDLESRVANRKAKITELCRRFSLPVPSFPEPQEPTPIFSTEQYSQF